MLRRLFRFARAGAPRVAADFFHAGDLPLPATPKVRDALLGACASVANGDLDAARKSLLRACAATPELALAHALLGAVQERMAGSADAAYAAARRADTGGALAVHLLNRGRHYLNEGSARQAERCLILAHRLSPLAAAPLEMLGFSGYVSGDVIAGRAWYDRALEAAAPEERGAIAINRLINTIPQIATSAPALTEARAAFEHDLDGLLADPPHIADPLAAINRTPFYLCYQGANDRESHARLAALLLRCSPSLAYVAAHVVTPAGDGSRKLRIGFASANLGRHSVGAWYGEMVRLIFESERFEVTLLTWESELAPRMQVAAGARHWQLEMNLESARARIESARLDMLIYTDVAMHPFPWLLAFSRLAPVQAILVGHPATSGIPALDWFVSNAHQDLPGAQSHYSEKLVRLPRIAVYVEQPTPPTQALSRAQLGMDEDTRYYLCPMMLQKIHPDFDWALAEILRRDPAAEIMLFADRARPLWQRQLEARFAHTVPESARRITFRPFAARDEFMSLLLASDAVLDTFHFSGGVTSYIALSLGVPVITLPDDQFRSRMTAGMLAQAGVADCVAHTREGYDELALRFAREPGLRADFACRIHAAHASLFATADAVDMLADWIEHVCRNESPTRTMRHE